MSDRKTSSSAPSAQLATTAKLVVLAGAIGVNGGIERETVLIQGDTSATIHG